MYRSTSEYIQCCKETFRLFLFVDYSLKANLSSDFNETSDGHDSNATNQEKGIPLTLSRYGAECAFATITGYRVHSKRGLPSSLAENSSIFSFGSEVKEDGLTEEAFLCMMKECAARDTRLVASDQLQSWSFSKPVGTSSTRSTSCLSPTGLQKFSSTVYPTVAWPMYQAIAEPNGFITIDDMKNVEKPKHLYEGLLHERFVDRKLFKAMSLAGIANSNTAPIEGGSENSFTKETVSPEFSVAEHLFHRLDPEGSGKIRFSNFKTSLS